PEGDAPRRVDIAPDGSVAVVSNVLSDNVSIIDFASGEVLAIIPIGDRVQDVAITPDSRYAVICGFNTNSVMILDLLSNEIVADVPTGQRPGVVTIHPEGTFAYVGNISTNSVSMILLDGANSAEVDEIPVGTIGVVWAGYGVSSDIQVSPDGEVVLVACSFDDQVTVLDAGTLNLLTTVPVGDFPIQIAFNNAGDRAIVSDYFDDTYSLIAVDGENSNVINQSNAGDAPLRVAYNGIADEFGVGNYTSKTITLVEAEFGQVSGTLDYSNYGALLQLKFDSVGEPVVLSTANGETPAKLFVQDIEVDLPAGPSYFAFNSLQNLVAVTMPGPDYVTLISELGEADLPPSRFNLLEPEAIAFYSRYYPEFDVGFVWEESVDPDEGDEVTYSIHFEASILAPEQYDTTVVVDNILNTDEVFNLSRLLGVEPPMAPEWTPIEIDWYVTAESGPYSIRSNQVHTVFLDISTDVDEELFTQPLEFNINQIFPNPFNSEVSISYSVPKEMDISLQIFNLQGQLVANLIKDIQSPGSHTALWRANRMASGVYVVRLENSSRFIQRKIMLMR
ncbi:beta-propeller fold lactonase family protein, partial [bacterium]|nr:beta-propeller fold lactonase family protein [bacterium]